MSEIERELREAGKELWLVTLEWKRTEAKGPRGEMDAAGGGVNWEAAYVTQGSQAEMSSLGAPGVGVNQKGSLGEQAP